MYKYIYYQVFYRVFSYFHAIAVLSLLLDYLSDCKKAQCYKRIFLYHKYESILFWQKFISQNDFLFVSLFIKLNDIAGLKKKLVDYLNCVYGIRDK